jgi:hypothetical protein
VALVGFWSAVAAAVFSAGYSVAQLLALARLLPFPWDQILIFAPSLLLAPAFVLLLVCIHEAAPADRRLWSHAGLAFASLYAALVSIVYIVQLFVVIPQTLRGQGAAVAIFAVSDGAVMTAIDALGYGVMSLAMLLAASAIVGDGTIERWIRRLFVAQGLLALPTVLAFFQPLLLILGIGWMVTVPGSTALLAVFFRRLRRGGPWIPGELPALE